MPGDVSFKGIRPVTPLPRSLMVVMVVALIDPSFPVPESFRDSALIRYTEVVDQNLL